MELLFKFGHGRALETTLGVLKINLAVSLSMSELALHIPATSDLAWSHSTLMIGAPLFLIGALQVGGVMLNMAGREWSWLLRAVGATVAIFLWSTVLLKSSILGQSTLAIPMAITFLPASLFLFYKAWNRLPIPGSPGLG